MSFGWIRLFPMVKECKKSKIGNNAIKSSVNITILWLSLAAKDNKDRWRWAMGRKQGYALGA